LGPVLGLVDRPDGVLKTHQAAAVPLGGVGVLLGTHVGLGLVGRLDPLLLIGTLVLVAVGLADDRFGLSPVVRLSIAVLAGAVMAFSERSLAWGLALVALVVICVNAVNLIDGIDALAGSTAAISLAGLGILALTRDAPTWSVPLACCAALLGFLVWNRPPARIFLGDNGAYVTGSLLAYTSLAVARNPGEALAGVALIGFPLFDLAVTLLRRLRAPSSLFFGDRDHTYDRLNRLPGWSPGRVTATIALLQALWVGLLVVSERASGPGLALGTAAGLGVAVVVWAVTRNG
jgi:UDP-GlcNAc:undecaprenyl-phosphate GlcNAc-1-phosphate transferase